MSKIHRQWFNQELEKKEKLMKHQPIIVQRIQNDYNKLEDLATERISLAEAALKLVKGIFFFFNNRQTYFFLIINIR